MGWVRCGLGTPSSVLSLPTPSEASGAIARFNTDLTENLLSAVAEFSASQAEGTPTPANPIPIVGVDKVNVTRCGKNLIQDRLLSKGINSSGVIGSSSSNDIIIAPVKQGQKYAITSSESNKVYAYYTDKPTVGSTSYNGTRNSTGSSQVSVTAEIDGWIAVRVPNTDTNSQIEFGETITAYEAPTVVTALINLGGTYFGGSVDAVTGKIPVKKKLILFDGSSDEGWVKTSGNYFYIPVADALSTDDRTEIQSNIIVYATTSATVWGGYLRNGRIYVNTDGTPTDANAFKTWLASNNMQVVYPLETPETEYASNTAEIPTIVGDNQVFADSGDVAVKYFETVGHKI